MSCAASATGVSDPGKKSLERPAFDPDIGQLWLVGYSSGQRGLTVNQMANAFDGSNPSPTTTFTRSRWHGPELRGAMAGVK